MARPIDADELMKEIEKSRIDNNHSQDIVRMNHEFEHRHFMTMVCLMPTIDSVKHGKWLCEWDSDTGTTEVTCSACKSSRKIIGCYIGIGGEHLYDEDDYCPNCGARMDGE